MDTTTLDLNTVTPSSLDYTSLKYPVLEDTTTPPDSTTFLATPDYSNLEQQTRSTLPIDVEEAFTTLEKELLDDLEDTVLGQIEFYRNNLSSTNQAREDEHAEDVYEMQGFYWGGEDCCEMIPHDGENWSWSLSI